METIYEKSKPITQGTIFCFLAEARKEVVEEGWKVWISMIDC
jgi:hypothetical protein